MIEEQISNGDVLLKKGENDLEKLVISNEFAHCEIYLQGAHVTEYTPKKQQNLLWLSSDATFAATKAIRGGIPICWPWFGPSPDKAGGPAHGFVRNRLWQLKSVCTNDDNATEVVLVIKSNKDTLALWPFEFALECKFIIAETLTISLTTQNLANKPMNISEAIHSYFAVKDIAQVTLNHLDDSLYVDKLANNVKVKQIGPVSIDGPTDRIYVNSSDEQQIVDSGLMRIIKVQKQGAKDTVVWNPWIDIAKGMADFNDLGYRNMLCVEAVNSQLSPVIIEQGQSHTTVQVISVQNID